MSDSMGSGWFGVYARPAESRPVRRKAHDQVLHRTALTVEHHADEMVDRQAPQTDTFAAGDVWQLFVLRRARAGGGAHCRFGHAPTSAHPGADPNCSWSKQ